MILCCSHIAHCEWLVSMGRTLKEFSKKVALTDGAHYSREAYQSYMTSPEWLSVDISEDFANFLGAGHSMFHFPYFYKIYQLWRVFFLALGASIRESGFFNTIPKIGIFKHYNAVRLQ